VEGSVAVQETNRRTFYLTVIYSLWAVIGGALSIPAAVYLLLPPRARKQSGFVEAANLGELTPDVPEEVTFRRNRVDGWKIISEKTTAWVVKSPKNDVIAFAPQCTHLGCAYHWEDKEKYFLCPCHTSTFSIDGRVLSGPAPRPLDRYEVKLEGSKVLIGGMLKPGGAA
jgi:menaquinol-cytochrome c reductase iron-sulfur subunit